jgi:hypothetical protein
MVCLVTGWRTPKQCSLISMIGPVHCELVGHALPVCFAILGCHFTVVVNKPREHIDKDNIRLAEAPLLEGSCDERASRKTPVRAAFIVKMSALVFFMEGMLCTHCCTVVVISALRVVRHLINHRWEGSKVGQICIGHEESVDFLGTGTEEKINCGRHGRAVCLGTATEMKEKFNQRLKIRNSLDWFGCRWEFRFHVRKGGFCCGEHGDQSARRWLILGGYLENC